MEKKKKEIKTKAISVRVSEKEYIRFKEIASEKGCTPPQLLKMWINNTDKGVFSPSVSENYSNNKGDQDKGFTICMIKNNIYNHNMDRPMKRYTFNGEVLHNCYDYASGVSAPDGGRLAVIRDFGLADTDIPESVTYWSRHSLYKDEDRKDEDECFVLWQEYGLWDNNIAAWTVYVSRLKYFSKYDDISELVRPYINARDDFGIRFALSDKVEDTKELEEYF